MADLQSRNDHQMDSFKYNANKEILKTNFTFCDVKNLKPLREKLFISKSTHKSIDITLEAIREYLDELKIDFLVAENLSFALYELVINAYEHGNLGIDFELKNELLQKHHYEEYLRKMCNLAKNQNKKIYIDIKLYNSTRDFLIIKIRDEGKGFDVVKMLKYLYTHKNLKYNGRGILMSESLSDGIFYNSIGNEVTVIKYLN